MLNWLIMNNFCEFESCQHREDILRITKDEFTLGDDKQNQCWAPELWASLPLQNQRRRRVKQGNTSGGARGALERERGELCLPHQERNSPSLFGHRNLLLTVLENNSKIKWPDSVSDESSPSGSERDICSLCPHEADRARELPGVSLWGC